ncbi:(2Fe-2S)-binding protein [Aureibacillus halotolerans]|uniref:Sarcosine oxidase subunit alpha n=1 Tax=Aureibacillus halotolerans TaxID=1508390 RepID=A0A4V3D4F3_9BACI|nr:(2Fe-2S)-binding protein [Aureibacillus halotolerans]TDQ35448.1 sarcosine oxidase subunit alpha [Aureibacillus halotolerans]
MNERRITSHPVLSVQSCRSIEYIFNDQQLSGQDGDTIASALMASGIRQLRSHEESGEARGIYCNIGHCFECRVTVNGVKDKRACLTLLTEHMHISSQTKLPTPFKKGGD